MMRITVGDMQRADGRLRKLVLLLLPLAIVAAGAVLAAFQLWLDQAQKRPPDAAMQTLLTAFAWTIAATSIVVAAIALYLWRMGARIRRTARHPLPGHRVPRDTRIRQGAAAQRIGRLLQIGAIVMLVCVPVLLGAAWSLYVSLGP